MHKQLDQLEQCGKGETKNKNKKKEKPQRYFKKETKKKQYKRPTAVDIKVCTNLACRPHMLYFFEKNM